MGLIDTSQKIEHDGMARYGMPAVLAKKTGLQRSHQALD